MVEGLVTKSKQAAEIPTLPELPEELEDDELDDELEEEELEEEELEDDEFEDEELELLDELDDEVELDDELVVGAPDPPHAASPKIKAAADKTRNGTALVRKPRYDM